MQHLDEGTIHAWLDGELPPAEQEAAEAHVATCDECKAAIAEARGFIAASSRILLALDAVPGGVLPASTASANARAPKRFTISRAWMAAAAVLVLSTATVIGLRPRRDTAIATVAVRDEASAPMVAAAPEPSVVPEPRAAPAEKAARERAETNAAAGAAQDKPAPSDEKDALRKKIDRQPMIVAEAPAAPAAPQSEPATLAAAAPARASAQFADSVGPSRLRRDAATSGGVPITGRVLSEAGAPLGTASVQLEGTGIVTLTHDDGQYALIVPESRVDGKSRSLVARLIGYKAAKATVSPDSAPITRDFVLSSNPLRLGEIVVTGAGTTSSVEKLGSSINSVDAEKRETAASGNSPRIGITLPNGRFAELTSRRSSGESGEPVDISLYRVDGSYITFIDRLRPDTTKATVDEPVIVKIEGKYDKRGATINRLAWRDSEGRMRTLRGPVSLELLRQLRQALENSTP